MFSKNYASIHKRNRVLAFLIMLGIFAGLGWLIPKWSEQPGSPALRTGQRIMYQMAGSQTLDKAGFYNIYPDGRPSDFVSFVQSRSGQILWPPRNNPKKSMTAPSFDGGMGNRLAQPANLTFAAYERTNWQQPQIVYSADEADQKLLVRGYDPGKEEPMFVYDFDFPTDATEVPLK